MGNLSFIEELGINEPTEPTATDGDVNVNNDLSSEHNKPNTDGDANASQGNTEPDEKLVSLKKQIEGLEKRLNDKDAYINELREASKQQQDNTNDGDTGSDEDFWDNPEGKFDALQKKFDEQSKQMHIQNLQVQEIHYANTVEKYWDVVSPDALRKAAAEDPSFADSFNNAEQPYKVAYEYLSKKNADKAKSDEEMKQQIIDEYLKEQGITKPNVDTSKGAPSMSSIGSSSGQGSSQESDDGFSSVFGAI